MKNEVLPSSFRDPAGFLFFRDGILYRQINPVYKEQYDHLIRSGLCKDLVDNGLLIPHGEVSLERAQSRKAYKVIKPEIIPFLSYPYEWCFSQLKDAALTTLAIQKKALDFGMSLKDASAYNIQFKNGKPVLIDTLSFEKYREGHPWVAYRQFCQHFLAPLALMSFKDVRLNGLLKTFIDGIPLGLASSLLPLRTRFKPSLLSHIHFHAKSQKHFADKPINTQNIKISFFAFRGLIDSLESAIQKLQWQSHDAEWGGYYENTNYSSSAFQHKKALVSEFLDMFHPRVVWDLGAHIGLFSRIASNKGISTIAVDSNPASVEKNYLECKKNNEKNLLPLCMDITNPSPNIGWGNEERMSLLKRGPADTMLVLALIHHLALSNNVPLDRIARFFSGLCNSLIIEFVPKNDSQVKKLLATREDIFPNYTQQAFETAFSKYFTIRNSEKIRDSERILYCMRKL
ncbi:SAM-dependent methyltransferase [Patescibacteria group bacterium]|nr:SAM-dependent methyltransferase [Patescibacteria group bacterium]